MLLLQNMDIKQLRQLSRKLMKANKSLIFINEKLHKDKLDADRENEQLRAEFGKKLRALETENDTFKRLLQSEDKANCVNGVLSTNTIEALKLELANRDSLSSDVETVIRNHTAAKPSISLECSQSENDLKQLEMVWRCFYRFYLAYNLELRM